MPGLLCGCTAGMTGSASTPKDPNSQEDSLDPLLDLSLPEEQELPFMTIGTTTALPMGGAERGEVGRATRTDGDGDEDEDGGLQAEDEVDDTKVSVLHMETRAHTSYMETMLAVGIDGCKQIREILEGVVKGSNISVVPATYGYNNDDDNMAVDNMKASDV